MNGTCFQYHHPHDKEVLECGRYPEAEEQRKLQEVCRALLGRLQQGLVSRARLRLAGCLTWYPVL